MVESAGPQIHVTLSRTKWPTSDDRLETVGLTDKRHDEVSCGAD